MRLFESIKALREKTLLTQEGLSKELGIAVSTVNRWEKGKARPNIIAMKAIKAFCETHNYPYEQIESGWLSHVVKQELSVGEDIITISTNNKKDKKQGDTNERN